MEGLKIRSAPSPVEMDSVRAFGAAATPIAWTETYMALEQNVVDGEMQQYHWAVSAKHEDVIRYINEIPAQYALHLALMDKKKYASFSPEVQGWIDQAAAHAQKFNFENAEAWNEKLKEQALQAGVEIYTPTDEEVAVWAEAGKKVWSKYADKVPAELIERIQAAQQ
jgi:TRAP-type C4-dicarboxylate transport system substrate-binding protein